MKSFALLHVLALLAVVHATAEVKVSTDFEGGSATIEKVDEAARIIRFMPGGDPQRGWPCWWYVKIDGMAKGETWTVNLGGSDKPARNNGVETNQPLNAGWALPVQAAISNDDVTWAQTAPGRKEGARMLYQIKGTGAPIWLAWGPPFTPNDTDALLARAVKALPGASIIEIARTREGRPVRALHLAETRESKAPALWIQARQHAWESGASWVAHGLVEWIISSDAEAVALRSKTEIMVVPIMDVDNVATGNGGKEANPRDHNRDWADTPVYPEVAAAQLRLRALVKEERLALFLDLHNPAAGDLRPFFFTGPEELLSPEGKARRTEFLAAAAARITGPLPLDPKIRTTGASYHPLFRQISGNWVDAHGNPNTVAACLETSWNTPNSTTEGYSIVGRQLAQAIADYMRKQGK